MDESIILDPISRMMLSPGRNMVAATDSARYALERLASGRLA